MKITHMYIKKFIIIFFVVLVVFCIQKNIFAQTPSPTVAPPGGIGAGLLPGVTCGNATSDSPDSRKCCGSQEEWASNNVINLTGQDVDWWKKMYENLKGIPIIGEQMSSVFGQILNIKDYALQLKRNVAPIPCPLGHPSKDAGGACICVTAITPTPAIELNKFCDKYQFAGNEKAKCSACAGEGGVYTGIGCVYGDASRFIGETVFGFAIGLAGVVALLCMVYASLQLQISRGNPEKIKKAQELLTSCIMGLILIIFSVFILRLIGVSILQIPGFG